MSTTDPFADVPGPLRTALHRRGFDSLTAVQRAVLDSDSEGRDLRISSETGSGKTLAIGFALARSLLGGPRKPTADAASKGSDTKAADDTVTGDATPPAEPDATQPGTTAPGTESRPKQNDGPDRERGARDSRPRDSKTGPVALAITPTRELAVQVRDELRWLLADVPGARVEVVTGGTDLGGERRMLRRCPAVLVGTPGRLLDHIRNGAVNCADIRDVVLDEADRMLDMGFREDLEAIIDALPAERRSHLVSATFSGAMRRVADRFQRNALHLQGTSLGQANSDIEHTAQLVAYEDRYPALVNALLLAEGEQVLVFVERRDGASELAEKLAGDGFAALPFSGDLSQSQRTRTLSAFRSNTIQVLVSTDVAARGIDVPDIAMVVHMTPPSDSDSYTHRSGRTGRAGRRGRSLLLVPPRARFYVTRLLSAARIEINWQPVPTPSKVRKAVTKRLRKRLHTILGGEAVPTEKTVLYAKQLLEDRDPAVVVATLLELAEPKLAREPMPVQPIPVPSPGDPGPDPGPPRRGRPHRGHVAGGGGGAGRRFRRPRGSS